jgi:nitroreductase
MTVRNLLFERRATRAFTDTPVPGEVLRQLLSDALQAPSGGNLQPWHIHVVTGAARERLITAIRDRSAAGVQEQSVHDIYPPSLWEPYRSRRFQNGEDLYRTLGIERQDKTRRFAQVAKNFEFFGAPVGLLFTMDLRMGPAQWMDLGIVVQTVMLLAQEHGLATCPQAAWTSWPATLAALLGLGEHETVVAGMALGYADPSHPINTLRSTRQKFEEGVTVHDGC